MNVKLFITAILAFTAYFLQGQVNVCDTHAAYGDSLVGTTIQCDTTGVNHGNAGPNMIWDYSNLVTDTTFALSHHYIDPATNPPGSSNFPTANFVDLTPVGVYSYYEYTPDSTLYLGNYASSVNTEQLADPYKMVVCPFAFSSSFTDSYAGTTYGSGTYTHQHRTTTTTYDGYGQLILPNATYPSVTRMKSVTTGIDSLFLSGGTFLYTYPLNYTTYTWTDSANFVPNKSVLLIFIEFDNGSKMVEYFNPTQLTTATDNKALQTANVILGPNPFNNSTSIEIKNYKSTDEIEFVLFNIGGQKVMDVKNKSPKFIIERADLPDGLYFYKVSGKEGTIGTGKLIIQ